MSYYGGNPMHRTNYARPWPEGEPTRAGVRCPMSDLLESECACRKHAKKEELDLEYHPAEPEEFDFR